MSQTETQIIPATPQTSAIQTTPTPGAQAFALLQRQAALLANSDIVPKKFKGNISNCAIAIEIANRVQMPAFMVMQNLDIIQGKPSFSSTYLIAMVNTSGRFTPLRYRMEKGEKRTVAIEYEKWEGPDGARRKSTVKKSITITDSSCVAWARDIDTNEVIEGPEVSMQMALDEGWVSKDGSKWLTMPELMLRYRAAAFFSRLYASDITLGMHTSDELQDMPQEREVTPQRTAARAVPLNPFPQPAAIEAPKEAPAIIEAVEDENGQLVKFLRDLNDVDTIEGLSAFKLDCASFINEADRTVAKRAVDEQADALALRWDEKSGQYLPV